MSEKLWIANNNWCTGKRSPSFKNAVIRHRTEFREMTEVCFWVHTFIRCKKFNCDVEQATKAQRRKRGMALLFFHFDARWGWVDNATPRLLYPRKDTVSIVLDAGWYQGRCRRMWKISPPQGFDLRTVQPIANLYTDYAIPAHTYIYI